MMWRLLVGSYTSQLTKGVHIVDVDQSSSAVVASSSDDVDNPSFVVHSEDDDLVYAVQESSPIGQVVALRRDGDRLDVVDRVPTRAGAPCHLALLDDAIFVANYGGAIDAYRLTDGGRFGALIGSDADDRSGTHWRQERSHPHSVVVSPDGASVYSADLGTDRIGRYVLDRASTDVVLVRDSETNLAAGSGPRHLAFHPSDPVLFVVCELNSTLVVCDVDTNSGALQQRDECSTLPPGVVTESLAAALCVHPDGEHVYVSNRGHDSIAVFEFDRPTRQLRLLAHAPSGGATPRDIRLDPTGQWLAVANQGSDVVCVHAIGADGVPTTQIAQVSIAEPTCVQFIEVTK